MNQSSYVVVDPNYSSVFHFFLADYFSCPSPHLNIFQYFSHVGCRLFLPYPALPYSFHIPTLSLYTVSSHRAVLPVSLHHSAISLSSSSYLSHSLCLSHTHIHTHSHTLSSLLPSQVSFLTCLFYLSMGSVDRLAQDQIKYNYFHQFSSLSVCLFLLSLSVSLSLSVDLSFSACNIKQNLPVLS